MSRSRVRMWGKSRRFAYAPTATNAPSRVGLPSGVLVIALVHDENAGPFFHRMCFPEHPTYPPRVITRAFRESEPTRVSARCFLLPISRTLSSASARSMGVRPSIKILRYASLSYATFAAEAS